jgi:ribonuclease P/MRP protein subunit RPP20
MGAAIPHLLTLTASIPAVLQLTSDQIRTEILTGTVEVLDEILPEDDDKDVSYEKRGKSTISAIIKIADGLDERPSKRPKNEQNVKGNKRKKHKRMDKVVMSEPEQEIQMDTA